MSIVDIGFSNKDGTGSVYIVSDETYDAIIQAGYVSIDLLVSKSIDYTQYNIFIVQWLDDNDLCHINFFNPVLDGGGNITLASYF